MSCQANLSSDEYIEYHISGLAHYSANRQHAAHQVEAVQMHFPRSETNFVLKALIYHAAPPQTSEVSIQIGHQRRPSVRSVIGKRRYAATPYSSKGLDCPEHGNWVLWCQER